MNTIESYGENIHHLFTTISDIFGEALELPREMLPESSEEREDMQHILAILLKGIYEVRIASKLFRKYWSVVFCK